MAPKIPLALVAALLVARATAIEYTVKTCADLADVDDTLVTGLTIDSSTFACDEYTRFRVRNGMLLKASVPVVEFSNFSLKVLGELTVEPDVTFTGVVDQVKNGGVLSVAEGATATFLGMSEFNNNSVTVKHLFPCGFNCGTVGRGTSYIVKKGGAIHNKGILSFDGDASFSGNEAHADNDESAHGGAISNAGSGSIFFKGNLKMEDNEAEGLFGGLGGAVYNRGDITVDGESYFFRNAASDGGGIYQTKIGTTTLNGMATFVGNGAFNLFGGGVFNGGGIMNFEAGSLFESNWAASTGDGGLGGGIFNGEGGTITLTGSTTFRENDALSGGAIYNTARDSGWNRYKPASITIFPGDTVFVGNTAENCPNVNNGRDENRDFICVEV